VRLREDALRAVRALRFSVTKGFEIDPHLKFALEAVSVLAAIEEKISDERIQVELSKMFRFDTVASLFILNEFPHLTRAMFAGSVSLDATMKTKGRG
jgi:tRNA nucleotidyltransferase/poly(A) polymerase